MTNPQPTIEGGVSEVEIISQQVEEETKSIAPVQLVNFAYRDLPLAALDLSVAGSQLLSNLDEEYQREGSNWLKPCCGRRAAVWQVFLLSASLNSFLVACVVLVVILLTLELLIDIKLLQFSSASQFAGIIHWISLVILSVFFSETILRIVVLGIWDYIENKIEVFDGAVIILSLAPMVASTVANGPSSPWDAISLIITLRIWRVKRIVDAYVLPVKVEMEMMIQQYEKAKVIQDEQLERLTQICQEQGFEIRQLRAHLAQQDLDLAAEREAALQVPHVLNKQSSKRYKVVAIEDSDDEATENITELRPPREDDMNNYISRYYNEPSSDSGIPEAAICMVTTAAIDVHRPNISSDLFTVEVPMRLGSTGTSASITSGSASRSTVSSGTQACSEISQTLGSSPDCSEDAAKAGASPQADLVPAQQRVAQAMVQELLSSLSEEACLAQKGLDPVNLKLPSPACSAGASPDLGHRLSVYNRKNQESLDVFQLKPLITCPQGAPAIDEKYGALGPPEPRLGRVPEA
ncbi:transmembrane protein 266 isoform X1 [Falco rusticolus]|uniref:transmembrane protein 266 isoform X1 n=1 Tax=Falco rusticolus TaxID=120794 RepID=UPI000386F90B|nr:transmembrane protein 266 isoform X1 [Falco rusticolus]XP_037250109.1 transmembrane protein 266 isoform X1 [Falco rusticolus]XP_037250110.1 transmembrane protein 266 isoform X1 [Falco rusticolus]XP_055571581.1 transmembrane protein 266 isoform X1 [Falco cherrug]XP_055571582.1 transmembrane protein 266 isoform X1 [Falco cherrug]XP_055571583.1 transmembrane protein 266 isoform X1 [Falco cherrug]XP_055571584.1 transmembrane protein 266 isoform X1 [Falco cherrug]XP_055661693.1 transmembrane p